MLSQSSIPLELRREFDQNVRQPQLRNSRIYSLICIALSLVFLVSDYYLLGDQFTHMLVVRLVVLPVFLILLYLSQHTTLKRAYFCIGSVVCLFNAEIVYIGIVAAEFGQDTYQLGTILIIIYVCTLMQAPIVTSGIIGGVSWLTYVLGSGLYSSSDVGVILNHSFVFGSALLLGVMSVMQREKYLEGNFMQAHELIAKKNTANKQALTDALTGLPNRYALLKKLEGYKGKVPADMFIMMVDVDNFKKLNDQYGHNVGDIALQHIADKLLDIVTAEEGFVARYGGEEFIVFLENAANGYPLKISGLILTGVAGIKVDELPPMTISIGGYITKEEDGSIGECIVIADQALLLAKARGKNQVIINNQDSYS
jgi:diguanylate cyclase (GGDEF)-like protein